MSGGVHMVPHETFRPALVTWSDPHEAHEKRIAGALARMYAAETAGDREKASRCWREFVALIAARASEKVAQMEAERGLR